MEDFSLQHGSSQSVVPVPAASASPGNLLEINMLKLHLRPTASETLRMGPTSVI